MPGIHTDAIATPSGERDIRYPVDDPASRIAALSLAPASNWLSSTSPDGICPITDTSAGGALESRSASSRTYGIASDPAPAASHLSAKVAKSADQRSRECALYESVKVQIPQRPEMKAVRCGVSGYRPQSQYAEGVYGHAYEGFGNDAA